MANWDLCKCGACVLGERRQLVRHWSCVEVLYMLSEGVSWLYSMLACFVVHQKLLDIFLRVCKPLQIQSLPPESVQVMGGKFIAEAVLPEQAHVCLLSTSLVLQESLHLQGWQEVCCCC